MNVFTSRRICVVAPLLFAFVFVGALDAADAKAAGKIEVTVLGEVLKKGKIQLRAPATIDDAFAAAGGFNREGDASAHSGRPAKYCVLMTRDHGIDTNMQVQVKVDLKSRTIRVIDEAKRTAPLKDGDTLIVPVITR